MYALRGESRENPNVDDWLSVSSKWLQSKNRKSGEKLGFEIFMFKQVTLHNVTVEVSSHHSADFNFKTVNRSL